MSTWDQMNAAARDVADRVDLRLADLEEDLAEQRQIVTGLTTDLRAASDRATELAGELGSVRAQLSNMTDEREDLAAELADQQRRVVDLTREAAHLRQSLDDAGTTIAARDATIVELRARLAELEPPVTYRDVTLHPYASRSFINLSRPVGLQLAPLSDPRSVALRSVKGGLNRTHFTTYVNRSDSGPAVPLVIQEVPEGGWRPGASDAQHVIEWAPQDIVIAGDMTSWPPVFNTDGSIAFPSAPPGTKPDGFFVLINVRTGEAIQAYKVCWGPRGAADRVLLARRGSVKTYDLRGDVLQHNGARATRLDLLGGLIRDHEWTEGINHVIYIAMTKAQSQAIASGVPGFIPPARGRDTAGGYTGVIPLGQFFYADPDVDPDTLDLSPGGLELFLAARDYGVVHTDTAGFTIGYPEQGPTTGPLGELIAAAKLDWQTKILPLMRARAVPPTMDELVADVPRVRPLLPEPAPVAA